MHGNFLSVLFALVLGFVLLSSGPPAYADVLATPGDAAGPGAFGLEPFEYETPSDALSVAVYASDDAPAALSAASADLVNCVCYDVRISGTDYTLLFPSGYESSLMVDSEGYLWNMSGSSITGRLFEGAFDPAADTGELLYLAPCLGNNFQVNHDYGSPNYIRSYYWSSSDRLSYTTSYVAVQVTDTFHLYNSEHLLQYVIIFLIGCCLICLWKRSGR